MWPILCWNQTFSSCRERGGGDISEFWKGESNLIVLGRMSFWVSSWNQHWANTKSILKFLIKMWISTCALIFIKHQLWLGQTWAFYCQLWSHRHFYFSFEYLFILSQSLIFYIFIYFCHWLQRLPSKYNQQSKKITIIFNHYTILPKWAGRITSEWRTRHWRFRIIFFYWWLNFFI